MRWRLRRGSVRRIRLSARPRGSAAGWGHRAVANFGDFRAHARRGREFVEAFLPDHCQIHVGDQQALCAQGGGLDDLIDAFLAPWGARAERASTPQSK
jgi:hypothetical protein